VIKGGARNTEVPQAQVPKVPGVLEVLEVLGFVAKRQRIAG
jgi:hypothetical protein